MLSIVWTNNNIKQVYIINDSWIKNVEHELLF